MKRIATTLALIILSISAFAQTAEEIIARMEKTMEGVDQDGISLTMDIKIPIIGTVSTTSYNLGNKTKIEGGIGGDKLTTWTDGKTSWTYNGKTNKIEIEDDKISDTNKKNEDLSILSGVTDGYDVSIKKEDDKAWYILCRKSRDNKEKDDPKTMDIVVQKGTYWPLSISASLSGVKMTMRNISFGVDEKTVTFNIEDFPGVPIEDKRKNTEGPVK